MSSPVRPSFFDRWCALFTRPVPNPVSYTHLDVYKRQVLAVLFAVLLWVDVNAGYRQISLEQLWGCLLYTSRCV